MPVVDEDGAAAADDSDRRRQGCSCLLPFCFWGAGRRRRPNSKPAGGAQAKTRRRRRRLRLPWLAWPWFRRSGKGDTGGGGGSEKQGKRMRGGRRLLLLLATSLQPKKALASVVSGDSSALLPLPVPVPAKVSSYGGDAKKQSNRRSRRPTVDDDGAASGTGSRQPQASSTAATASTGSATAHARSRPETTSQAPSPRPTDGPAASGGRTWRAPSRRQRHSLRHPGDCSSGGGGGLWTAATTLGVIVLLGRVAAVVFLCSCLYGARFVRAWAAGGAGASAKTQLSGGGVHGVSSRSRRISDPVGVAAGDKVVAEMCATEECKKKAVVMAGLLDRAGKTPSSRFGR